MAGETGFQSVMLWGDPEADDTQAVRDELSAQSLAHCFEPDDNLVRPIIQTEFGQFVGETEILRAIGKLLVPSVYSNVA